MTIAAVDRRLEEEKGRCRDSLETTSEKPLLPGSRARIQPEHHVRGSDMAPIGANIHRQLTR